MTMAGTCDLLINPYRNDSFSCCAAKCFSKVSWSENRKYWDMEQIIRFSLIVTSLVPCETPTPPLLLAETRILYVIPVTKWKRVTLAALSLVVIFLLLLAAWPTITIWNPLRIPLMPSARGAFHDIRRVVRFNIRILTSSGGSDGARNKRKYFESEAG